MRFYFLLISCITVLNIHLFSQDKVLLDNQKMSQWEKQVIESEKEIYKSTLKKELIRSEIMFFISLPITYLLLNLLYGDGGSDRFSSFPTGYSVLTTEIAYYGKLIQTNSLGKNIISRPVYHRDVFNATEIYIILLSLVWSFTIAFNNIYESLIIKSLSKTRIMFDGQRVSISLFTHYF